MISLIFFIFFKLFTFSQILQGVPKLSHAAVFVAQTVWDDICSKVLFLALTLGHMQEQEKRPRLRM